MLHYVDKMFQNNAVWPMLARKGEIVHFPYDLGLLTLMFMVTVCYTYNIIHENYIDNSI